MEINGKKAIVIGGASGMGRATAELLAERLRDPAGLTRAAAAARTQARTDAAERLADLVETLMHQETHA